MTGTTMSLACGLALVLLSVVFAQEDTAAAQRPNKCDKWYHQENPPNVCQENPPNVCQENPPKMVIFGDSYADTGRAFSAPAAHQFEEYGVGAFPWARLFAAPDSDEKIPAYMPFEGSVTNGKAWPTWLRVPDEHNFATSSATASSPFRNLDPCQGYTGAGEEFPTGTLEEQITRYFHDIGDPPEETLDHTHIIALGINDLLLASWAMTRYALGGAGYQDPVALDLVFQTDNVTGLPILDDSGLPVATFEPAIDAAIKAWDDGIGRLVEAGVTGTILLANIPAVKGLPLLFNTTIADVLDSFAIRASLGTSRLAFKYPQVKVLDYFTLTSALVDNPSIFEDLGFLAPEESSLTAPCISQNFVVDSLAEVMNTQALRHPDCQETCAFCADGTSPCQSCLEGNPSITVCEDPSTRVFYDSIHYTTEYHLLFGEAIRQCSNGIPNYDCPLVSVLCPPDGVQIFS